MRSHEPGSTPRGLEEAHRELTISPAQFDEVAAELARTLDYLAAFAADKGEVTEGYL
jgi:hemoglobin